MQQQVGVRVLAHETTDVLSTNAGVHVALAEPQLQVPSCDGFGRPVDGLNSRLGRADDNDAGGLGGSPARSHELPARPGDRETAMGYGI
jgi:hypothetical protein